MVLLVMAVMILRGKSDKLIAGYNTASPGDKKKYDVVRLRRIVAAVLAVVAIIMPLWSLVLHLADERKMMLGIICLTIVVISVCIIGIILCNTWVKRK